MSEYVASTFEDLNSLQFYLHGIKSHWFPIIAVTNIRAPCKALVRINLIALRDIDGSIMSRGIKRRRSFVSRFRGRCTLRRYPGPQKGLDTILWGQSIS